MYQDLSKFKLPTYFRGRNSAAVQIWWLVQSTLFRLSPQFCYGWRRFLLRCFGCVVGKGVIVRPTATITYPWKVEIGDNSWIGDDVVVYSLGTIKIGKNSVISQRSYLCAGSHDYKSESFDIFASPIVIQDEVWIATDVFVAPGVTVGKGVVIGSRSSVYRDMPEGMICMGIPAKPIKPRRGNEISPIQS